MRNEFNKFFGSVAIKICPKFGYTVVQLLVGLLSYGYDFLVGPFTYILTFSSSRHLVTSDMGCNWKYEKKNRENIINIFRPIYFIFLSAVANFEKK
jgi:hypothetical protein